MHKIKKYANRKLYDVSDKKYVTMDDIAELVQSGEDIRIVDNTNGEDITQDVLSQLLGRVFNGQARKMPLSVLQRLLKRGSGEIVGYTRKYLSFWQNALNLAEGELDRVDTFIGGDTPSEEGKEADRLDGDLEDPNQEYLTTLRLLDERIDQRTEETVKPRQLALEKQISDLSTDVTKLQARIETFENIFSQVLKQGGKAPSKPARKTKRSKKT